MPLIKMVPGPIRFAVSHVQDIKTAFELFIRPSIEKYILQMMNLEGKRMYEGNWEDLDGTHLECKSQKAKQQRV